MVVCVGTLQKPAVVEGPASTLGECVCFMAFAVALGVAAAKAFVVVGFYRLVASWFNVESTSESARALSLSNSGTESTFVFIVRGQEE